MWSRIEIQRVDTCHGLRKIIENVFWKLTSLALKVLSSPSCSESLPDSLPVVRDTPGCPLRRIQISTRAASSPRRAPAWHRGPRVPLSVSCFCLRSIWSAWGEKTNWCDCPEELETLASVLSLNVAKMQKIQKHFLTYLAFSFLKQTHETFLGC